MYTINFDAFTRAVIVNALDDARRKWQSKILEGDKTQGTLLMYEQLTQTQRGVLFAKKKEDSVEPSKDIETD